MNQSSLWRGILIAVLVIGAAAMIGVGAYNAGMAQGIAQGASAAGAAPPAVPYYPNAWHRPWGVGLFPIFPFFFLLFFFLILRGLWRGPGYYRGWGCGYGYPPPSERRADEAHPRS